MIPFKRENFFPKKNELDVQSLIKIFSEHIIEKKINSNFSIDDISSLEYQIDNSVFFIEDELFDLKISEKILIITSKKPIFEKFNNNIIFIKNFSKLYNSLINYLFLTEDKGTINDDYFYKNFSHISKSSHIHPSVSIGANCFIGKGVIIGKNSLIKNNVVIKNSIIGSNVIVSDNTSIGTTGFGFDYYDRGASNLTPHVGIVIINDNCYIGTSCTIDRAKINYTYIGKNSMIDNLVHIAHNVFIDDNACIAAQTGISGSVKIGKNVTIGGQTGFAGHISIGDDVIIAAKSGVTKNILSKSKIAGFPAIDIKKWKRNIIKERNNGYKWNPKDFTS